MAGALLLALLVHFLNVVILVAALHALGRPFEWAASLSVYQFGYVFAFLLPLAQGTGAVVLAGSAVLERLGIPGTTAVGAILLWRAHELWLPLLAGAILSIQRKRLLRWAINRLAALLLFWSGLLKVVEPLILRSHHLLPERLERVDLWGRWEISRHVNILVGFSSLLVAGQVWRRKKIGWLVAIGVLSLAVLQQLWGRRDQVVLALDLLTLGILLWRWRDFRVRSDVPSIVKGIRLALCSFSFAVLYRVVGLFLLRRMFVPRIEDV